MQREAETPASRIGRPEQADARDAEKIRRMKHRGIDAEKQVAFAHHREGIREWQAAGVNHAVFEFSELHLRLPEIEKEDHKVWMAFEERGYKPAQNFRRPGFL